MSSSKASPEKFSFCDWSSHAHSAENGHIRVLVVDSTRMASELLANVLHGDAQLIIVAAVASSQEALEAIDRHRPEVVLLSTSLEGSNTGGLELARELQSERPEIRVVALLETSCATSVVDAFRAGVSGVFSRDSSMHSLCRCIHSVYNGQIWATSEEVHYVLEALSSRPNVGLDENRMAILTPRERAVVELASEGLTNKEIANDLEISEHTVKNYMFSIFEKLGVSSRVELAMGSASRPNVVALRNGVNQDAAALEWLRELAEEGLASAQFLLGDIYDQGRRASRDRMEAYYWYLLAQNCDLHQAGDVVRRKLAKEMSPLQVAEAERRVVSWLDRKRKLARRA